MSGIYIKGYIVPDRCWDCPCADKQYGSCEILHESIWDGRLAACPLIPVPNHGRLVDADALWESEKSADALHKLRPKGESVIYDAGFLAGYRAAAQIASKMPTIIPASGGEDNG